MHTLYVAQVVDGAAVSTLDADHSWHAVVASLLAEVAFHCRDTGTPLPDWNRVRDEMRRHHHAGMDFSLYAGGLRFDLVEVEEAGDTGICEIPLAA